MDWLRAKVQEQEARNIKKCLHSSDFTMETPAWPRFPRDENLSRRLVDLVDICALVVFF